MDKKLNFILVFLIILYAFIAYISFKKEITLEEFKEINDLDNPYLVIEGYGILTIYKNNKNEYFYIYKKNNKNDDSLFFYNVSKNIKREISINNKFGNLSEMIDISLNNHIIIDINNDIDDFTLKQFIA